ncbi:hypothetical protein ABZ816_22700 [Actinosynnema sp. NPDC047251]|uniref:Uncharacterized protein n=1 Tax=Saccharothrix espanaensis (strain ATCC 51144 / DSM 44229 / JCM 9112 / NBRC 15066 / NRRL 15764) TaxID=1179773 RepID=K0K9Y9_SACES|nr:hypothetical protein [Saccharothrix espanaensis]CCH33589.1 hypothetical protein BN6_63450 [Saccharothrix espanaensis DSM 44229]
MAQENEAYEAPSSGLLLSAQALTGAVDRGKANGALDDTDGGQDK